MITYRIIEQRAQAIADAYKITAIVAPINKAPVLIAAPTPKPKKENTLCKSKLLCSK